MNPPIPTGVPHPDSSPKEGPRASQARLTRPSLAVPPDIASCLERPAFAATHGNPTPMKHPRLHSLRRLQIGVAALSLATALPVRAEFWQMLLPGPDPGAAPSNLGRDVIVNPFTSSPAPGIFLGTEKSVTQASTAASMFRLTPNDLASTSFTLLSVDGGMTGVNRLVYNSGDGLYAAGWTSTSSTSKGRTTSLQTWKVRQSPVAGQGNPGTWGDVDSFNLSTVTKGKTTAYDACAYGITGDDLGNMYVSGRALDGWNFHWIIRKKSPTGGWSTVLDLAPADGHSIPYDVCFVPRLGNNPEPAVFVAGHFNGRWTVLRSVDRGGSWQEPLQARWPEDGSIASAYDVASDSDGNVYVAGVRGRNGQNNGWVLRRSEDGGTSWQTLLDQPSADGSWAGRLSVDERDVITLAGGVVGADGTPRWAIVRNSPGQAWFGSPTASWETLLYPLGANTPSPSKGRGVVSDASGNTFMIGDVIDWTDPADSFFYPGTRVGLLRLVP